jgi:hypothetical protein
MDVGTTTSRGRRVRLAVTAVLFGALLAGTVWGDDIDFPFGPFRMYASTEPVNGVVSTYVLRGRIAGQPEEDLAPVEFGVRAAELEGRLGELTADCRLMQELMKAYADRHPGQPSLVDLVLVRRSEPMLDGQVEHQATDEEVAAACR